MQGEKKKFEEMLPDEQDKNILGDFHIWDKLASIDSIKQSNAKICIKLFIILFVHKMSVGYSALLREDIPEEISAFDE